MSTLARLSQRLFNVPLAIHPRKAEVVVAALAERLGVLSINGLEPRKIMAAFAMEDDDYYAPRANNPRGGYDVVNGAAIIAIQGTLVNKLGSLRPYSGMTGYDGIRQNFMLAMDDPSVKGIMLDVDSPGGEVAGCFDLCDAMRQARGIKPVHAILSENAYSAGYALASTADRISVPRTGGVGSIGVIAMHVDLSQALAKEGIKVTFVTHGERKADGHPEVPLSDSALARMQEEVSAMGELFIDVVAANRKGLKADAIRAMQAGCFMGAAGVEQGLADVVQAPDAAFRDLVRQIN